MRTTNGVLRRALGGAVGFYLMAALTFAGCDDDRLGRVVGELEVVELMDFGPVSLGRTKHRRVEVRNVGRAPVQINHWGLEKPVGADWTVDTDALVTLEAGQTIELPLSFAPASLGVRAARLTVENDSERTPSVSIELRGEGVLGKAELDAADLDFGKVAVSTAAVLPIEFTNSTAHPAEVTLFTPAGDDPDEFHTVPSGDIVVPPGETLVVEVSFRPQRLGLHNARLDVLTCPTCDRESISLRGEGIAATLEANPREVDFGYVEPGHPATRQVEITNRGTNPARIRAVSLDQDVSNEFSTAGVSGTVTLGEGESVIIEVTFTPQALASREGALRIEATANGDETLLVPLKGHGGGPDIVVRPESLGFPRTGVGLSVEKSVVIYNAGHDPTGNLPLEIRAIYIDAASSPDASNFSLSFRRQAPVRPVTLQAGVSETVFVTFNATREGRATAFLHIESNDSDEPLLIVPLTASASVLGPCEWESIPPQLNFGAVNPDESARLSFGIRNIGPNPCGLANIRLSSSTPPVFSMDHRSTVIIEPGEQLVVPVRFAPDGPGSWTGRVEFDVVSPTAPRGQVELIASSIDSCLEFEPQTVDYGVVGLQCIPPVRRVAVHNACAVAVDLHSAFVGASGSDEFRLQSGGLARTLQPGEQTLLEVTYEPTDEGPDDAPLFVQTSISPDPLLVGLVGEGALRPMATDTYVQPERLEVDVLFVVDNSGSFIEEQDYLAANFDRFIQSATARGVDYHLAVTTTGLYPYRGSWSDCPGGVNGGEAGRFFPVDNSRPRILTPATPNVREVFMQNVHVGICHWWEEGLEAARLALSPPLIDHYDAPNHPEPNDGNAGFLRPDAKLSIVWLSDEEDSGSVPTQEFIEFFLGLKPGRPDLVTGHAVVGMPSCITAPSVGTRYMAVANALGGLIADVCDPDWGGVLQRIGEDTFTARTVFPLSQAPDGRDFVITIDGVDVPAKGPGSQTRWRYDPTIGAFGAIVFESRFAPGPNTTLDIGYPVPCPPSW